MTHHLARKLVAAASVGLLIALTGCGGSDSSEESNKESSSKSSQKSTEESTQKEPSAGESLDNNISTMEPLSSADKELASRLYAMRWGIEEVILRAPMAHWVDRKVRMIRQPFGNGEEDRLGKTLLASGSTYDDERAMGKQMAEKDAAFQKLSKLIGPPSDLLGKTNAQANQELAQGLATLIQANLTQAKKTEEDASSPQLKQAAIEEQQRLEKLLVDIGQAD